MWDVEQNDAIILLYEMGDRSQEAADHLEEHWHSSDYVDMALVSDLWPDNARTVSSSWEESIIFSMIQKSD